MQTNNSAVAELTAIINAAPNGIEDHINNVLTEYPAVWDALFEANGTDASDAELTEQAVAATGAVADLIDELS